MGKIFQTLEQEWQQSKNGETKLSDLKTGSHKKYWWKCQNGHSWKIYIFFRTTHKRKSGCPDCSKRVSKGEQDVRKFTESVVEQKSINNNRSIIAPYELDIFFPESKIAIEYNGTYWHSDIKIRESHNMSAEKYHSQKIDKCREKDITLLLVWQDDWEQNTKVMKDSIRKALLNNKISPILNKLTNREKEGEKCQIDMFM